MPYEPEYHKETTLKAFSAHRSTANMTHTYPDGTPIVFSPLMVRYDDEDTREHCAWVALRWGEEGAQDMIDFVFPTREPIPDRLAFERYQAWEFAREHADEFRTKLVLARDSLLQSVAWFDCVMDDASYADVCAVANGDDPELMELEAARLHNTWSIVREEYLEQQRTEAERKLQAEVDASMDRWRVRNIVKSIFARVRSAGYVPKKKCGPPERPQPVKQVPRERPHSPPKRATSAWLHATRFVREWQQFFFRRKLVVTRRASPVLTRECLATDSWDDVQEWVDYVHMETQAGRWLSEEAKARRKLREEKQRQIPLRRKKLLTRTRPRACVSARFVNPVTSVTLWILRRSLAGLLAPESLFLVLSWVLHCFAYSVQCARLLTHPHQLLLRFAEH